MSYISDYTPSEIAAQDAERIRKIEEPIRRELDRVTRLLCEVLGSRHPLTTTSSGWDVNYAVKLSNEVIVWWAAHEKADLARAEKEAKEKQIWALEREIERLKKEIK